jgi:CRISPR-associated protein Cas5a/b/c
VTSLTAMIGFLVDIEFLWGFQAKVIGYSKSAPAFTYPPPTTFLGAVAEVLAKKHSLGEKKGKSVIRSLSSNLLALGLRPLNFVPLRFADINKVIAVRRSGKGTYPNPRDPYGSFDAPAHGRTILSLITESEEGPTLRYYLVLSGERISLEDGRTIQLESDDLWEIHRLGSKESLVSVINLESFTPRVREGQVTTSYSFPTAIMGVQLELVDYTPIWIVERIINPFAMAEYDPLTQYILAQNLIDYNYPVIMSAGKTPSYIVRVGGAACYYEWGEERVIGVRPAR